VAPHYIEPQPIDNDLIPPSEKGNPNLILRWTALIILWIGIAFCVAVGLTSEPRVIVGMVLLALSTVMTYFKPEVGIKITLGVIVLGVVSLLTFSPFYYEVGIGIGNFRPSIQVLPLLIGILHFFTNKEVLAPFLKSMFNREVSKEDAQAIERGKIDGFKKRYARKSASELRAMTENKGLLPEARKAAGELLEEIDQGPSAAL